jgi:hypothetical protein
MRTRQRENRLGAVASAMVALAAILAACSRDLSVNNLTLTPTPVTTADLVSSQGQCPLPPLAPTQSAVAGQAQAEPGGIALEMSECEVVHRTGPVEKMELGYNRTRRALPRAHLSQGSLARRVSLYCGPPGIDRASAGCPGAAREGSHPQQKTRRKLRLGTSRETAVIPGPRVEPAIHNRSPPADPQAYPPSAIKVSNKSSRQSTTRGRAASRGGLCD